MRSHVIMTYNRYGGYAFEEYEVVINGNGDNVTISFLNKGISKVLQSHCEISIPSSLAKIIGTEMITAAYEKYDDCFRCHVVEKKGKCTAKKVKN